jgi:signal transduction histidine kinase/ActR/RegA family two-component response regulator
MVDIFRETTAVTHVGPLASLPLPDQVTPRSTARLVMLAGGLVGQVFQLDDEIIIGRGSGATIELAAEDVSRRHARITQTGGDYFIEDLASRNGTFVNGLPIVTQTQVRFGDKIQVGAQTVLLFSHRDPAEDQLLQAQKLESIGLLAGGIAHDINNMVASVLGNVRYLREAAPQREPSEVESCLSDCEEGLVRIADLVKGLLNFARRGKLEHRPNPLLRLIQEALGLARHAGAAQVDVQVPATLEIMGDGAQLLQLFLNLFINALDAMPNGGELAVSAEVVLVDPTTLPTVPTLRSGRFCLVTVRDSGTGMSTEVLGRLFEPFFTTKEAGKGTGLGLATSYGIVQSHCGHISVDSVLGVGTTFQVYLPFIDTDEVRSRHITERTAAVQPRDAKLLILVVDDEPLVRRSATRLLGLLFYEVLTAANGEEALVIYKNASHVVSLILLDLCMPGMPDETVLAEIKKINPAQRVLVTSGSCTEEDISRLMQGGAHGFLRKPYRLETLRDAIQAAIS